MGTWGYYDDENDTISDDWVDIKEEASVKFTRCLIQCNIIKKNPDELIENEKYDEYVGLREVYLCNNMNKLYSVVRKHIAVMKKQKTKTNRDACIKNYHINGLIVRLIKFKQKVRISDPLGAGIFSSGINITLKELPKDIVDIGLMMTKRLLKNIDDDCLGWKTNLSKRKNALNHLLYVYTNGKQGIKSKRKK